MTYKENWLYKASYNSYTVEDKWNSVCEQMLVDSGLADRSLQLLFKKKQQLKRTDCSNWRDVIIIDW